eukprot:gene1422-15012_t
MPRGVILSLLVVVCAACSATALTWAPQPDAPGRSDACGGVLNGTIVMAGGHADSNYTNDVWVLRHAPWSPRSYHSCV